MNENDEVTEVEKEKSATDTTTDPLADWEAEMLADASSAEEPDNRVYAISDEEAAKARAFAQAHTDYPIAESDSKRRSARRRLASESKQESTEEPPKDTTADDLNACLKAVEGWIAENERAPKRKLRGDVLTLDDVARLGAVVLHHVQTKYPNYTYEGCRPIAHSLLFPFEYLLRFGHFVDRDGDNIYSSFRDDLLYAPSHAGTLGDDAFIDSFNKWTAEPEKAEIAFKAINEVLKPRKDMSHQPGSQWYTSDEDLVQTSPVPHGTAEELIAQLNKMTGLDSVKRVVQEQVAIKNTAKARSESKLSTPDLTEHILFTGNPGTGKTTVARIIAGIYRSIGILDNDYIVEVDAAGLISKWSGHTPGKTNRAIDEALGGVLFVDEAYSLMGDRGQEALDALVKRMEDDRDDLVVILAGYPDKMDELLGMNPGLKSRLGLTIEFPDYSDAELITILNEIARANDFWFEDAALDLVGRRLATTPRGCDFGNARLARTIFESATRAHALRISPFLKLAEPTPELLSKLTIQDVRQALDRSMPKASSGKLVGFGQVAS